MTYLFEIHYKVSGIMDYETIRGANRKSARKNFLELNPSAVIISCSRISN